MEDLVTDPNFWRYRRVFLTGHTGFKGAWMSLLLGSLGAKVEGLALPPDDSRNLFVVATAENDVVHRLGDIRDFNVVQEAMARAEPEIVIHMAAQSLVRRSYEEPVETYATNVMGTVHVLEAVRHTPSVRAALVITSDKCYENAERLSSYSETDTLGGRDPYSNSKGCAELVTSAYRRSFFDGDGSTPIASARAGNVIGGGDWSRDRLVPDAMQAFMARTPLHIRNSQAVRPWQHVIDPILAYLGLVERLVKDGAEFAEGWNFGPAPASEVSVGIIADELVRLWGKDARWMKAGGDHPHEAAYLKLDCAKATDRLGWTPQLPLDEGLRLTVEWYKAFESGADMRAVTRAQIDQLLQRDSTSLAPHDKSRHLGPAMTASGQLLP